MAQIGISDKDARTMKKIKQFLAKPIEYKLNIITRLLLIVVIIYVILFLHDQVFCQQNSGGSLKRGPWYCG